MMLKKLFLPIIGISVIAQPIFNSAEAIATTIDFTLLNNPSTGLTAIGNSYSEDGFTISQDPSEPFLLTSINAQDVRFNGSTSLFNNTPNGVINLTKDGGGAFNLNSIDLDWLNGGGNVPVNFIGTKTDSSTVLANFQLDQTSGFETFNFTGFDNLLSVSWVQETSFHHFDDIVVNDVVNDVPEPFTILGTILAGAFGIKMKRKQKLTN